jgi:pimeloyl-ACP methyl ester carboxylesterase
MTSSASAPMEIGMSSHWMGTLNPGGHELRIVVEIKQSSRGTLDGSMHNFDIGWMNIPISAGSFQKSAVRFEVSSIDASYAGKIHRSGQKIEGTWTMNEKESPLILHRVLPSPIDGIWTGTLQHASLLLRLVFYIGSGPENLIATMKSLDQSESVIPIHSVTFNGETVVLESDAIGARFTGRLNPELGHIEGKWYQSALELPLDLRRIEDEEDLESSRPQVPVPPYPYRESEIEYQYDNAGPVMAGTLTLPEGEGPFPAVLLIAGSGGLDRDESMCGHRPFLVLADALTRRGIAVLRADKRGVGESGGDYMTATTSDFARDAEAGVACLKRHPDVDGARIGLIGHSEGGLIACMLASRNPDVRFIVLMAAPGVTGRDLAGQQGRREAAIQGFDPDEAERRNKDLASLLVNEKDEAVLRRKLEQMFSPLPEPQRTAAIENAMHPWQRHIIGLNPADYLVKVKCPVLALNGEHDATVEPESNLAAIRQALVSGQNDDFEICEIPGLNHLFQTCSTGSPTEYGQIEETLSPVVLGKIAEWINASR